MQSNNNPTSSNTPGNNAPNGSSTEQINRSYTPKPSREPGNGPDNVDSYDQGPGSGGRYGTPYVRDSFRDRDDRGRSRFTGSFNSYRRPSRPRDELSPPPAKRRKLDGDDPDLPPFKRYDDSPPYYNNNRYGNHYNSYDRPSDFNNKDRFLSNSGPPSRPYNNFNNGPGDKPFYQRDRNFREDNYRGPRQNFGGKRFFPRGGGPHKMGRGGGWYQNRDDRHEGGGGYRDNNFDRRERGGWAPRGGRFEDRNSGWDNNYRNEKDRWNTYNPRYRRDDRDNTEPGRDTSPRGRRLSTSRSRSRSRSRSHSRSRSYSPSSPNYGGSPSPAPRSRSVSPAPATGAPISPRYSRERSPPPFNRNPADLKYPPISPTYSPTSPASASPPSTAGQSPNHHANTDTKYAPTSPRYSPPPTAYNASRPPLSDSGKFAPTSPNYSRDRSPPQRETSPPRFRDRPAIPLRDRSPPPRERSPPPRERDLYIRDRSPPPRERSPFNRDRSPPPRDRSPRYSPRHSRSPSPRGRSPVRLSSDTFYNNPYRRYQQRDRRNSRSMSPPPRSPPYSPRGRYGGPRNMAAPRPMKPVPNSLNNSGPSPSPSPVLPDANKSNSSSQKTPNTSPVKPVNPSPIKPPLSSPVQASPSFSRGAASTLRHSVAGGHPAAPANGKSARRDMILIEIDNKDNEIGKAMKELEDLKKEKDRLFKLLASKREQLEAEMKKAESKEPVDEDKKAPTQSAEELQKAAEQEEKRLRDTVTEQSKFVQMDMDASKPLFERITEYNKKMASSALDPLKKLFPFETPKAIFRGKELAVTFKHITELPFFDDNFKICQRLRPSLIRVRQKRVVDARDRERKIRDKYVTLVHKWKRRLQQQRQLRRQQKLEEEIKKQAAADREGKGRGRVIGRRLTLRSSAKAINGKDMPPQIDLGEEGESYQYSAQDEKMRRLQEKKDFESRFLRTLAYVPAMIVDQDRKKLKFIDNNRLVEDSVAVYKEYRSRHMWSEEEEEIFVKYYLKYPKDFVRVASYLPNKSTKDVIYYYYNNKMRLNLKERARAEDEERRRSDPTRGRYLDDSEIHTFGTSVDWVNGSSRRGSIRLSDKPAINYSERTATIPVVTPPPPMDRRRLDIPERPSSAPGPDEATRWSEAEKELFKIHFVKHLKDFKAISDEIKTKNIAQVKNFYHNNKRKLGLDKILTDATTAQEKAEKLAAQQALQPVVVKPQPMVPLAPPAAIPTSNTPPPTGAAPKGRRGRPRNTSKSVTPTNTAPSAFAMPTGPTIVNQVAQQSTSHPQVQQQQSNLNVVLPAAAAPQSPVISATSPPIPRAATPVVKEGSSSPPMHPKYAKDILTSSHWTDGEKQLFLQQLSVHGKNWKVLSDIISTKTVNQIKNYYQNYRNKLNLDELLPDIERNPGRGRGKKRGNLSRPRGRPRKPKSDEDSSGASTLASLDGPVRRSRISSLLNDSDTLEDIRASDLRGHDDDEDSLMDDNYEDDDDGGDIMDVEYSESSVVEKDETSQDVKSFVLNAHDERSDKEVINENTNNSVNNTNSNAGFNEGDQMDTSDSVAQNKQIELVSAESSQQPLEDKPQEKTEPQPVETKAEVKEKSREVSPQPVEQPEQVAEKALLTAESEALSAKQGNDVEMSDVPEDQPAQEVEQKEADKVVSEPESVAQESNDQSAQESEPHKELETQQPGVPEPETGAVKEHQAKHSDQSAALEPQVTEAPVVAEVPTSEPEEKEDRAAVPDAPIQDSNEGKADAESVYDPTEPTDDAH